MVEEEPQVLSGSCTKIDYPKVEQNRLIVLAFGGYEGAMEEVKRRGLEDLLPKIGR